MPASLTLTYNNDEYVSDNGDITSVEHNMTLSNMDDLTLSTTLEHIERFLKLIYVVDGYIEVVRD